jgi:Zn-finger nucleic acid-binding protein
MENATVGSTCPVCSDDMTVQKGKMNLQVQVCPANHGSFVEPDRLHNLVEETTIDEIRAQAAQGGAGVTCPACAASTRQIDLAGILADVCAECAGIWFSAQDLERHQQAWRSRAYGENSFVSRTDVLEETGKLYAAEVIAGVLAEFELSIEEEPF